MFYFYSEDTDDLLEPDADLPSETEPTKDQMQTFVFSATMSKDLQQNLKKRQKPRGKRTGSTQPASTLGKGISFLKKEMSFN
jgi:ATP-dependent RNA helicase DDX24/MAK5